MDDQTIEKLAELLGKCAATGDSRELMKQAGAEQLILPLLSATAGGAAGYLGTKKEKNKTRNAIYGALGSGLAGAGLQALAPMADDFINGKSDSVNLGGNPGPGSGGGMLGTVGSVLGFPINRPVGTGVALASAAAAERTGASKSVGEMLAKLYDKARRSGKYVGELGTALTEGKIKPLKSGKGAVDPARVLQSVIDQNPNANAVKYLRRTGHFPPTRAGADKLVAELNTLAAAPKGGTTLPGDFLTQLQRAHKGPAGRRFVAGAGRAGTNIGSAAGGYLTTSLLDWLGHYFYNLRNGQPK
jgi:hypothetical protein